jgi:subfamily B ATP-binding cassette protein MsbA
VALVGPTGAGKTSLVNLLPRFITPTDGQVLLDGVPLAQWDVRALRRQFAFVSQDVVLFNDSVAANVALGAEVDPARVRQALEGAHLAEFVDSLPQGMNTSIGHNGGQLSGGQRQRLAIARALYKDAPVLILDEATSALDSESERAVQAALEHLMRHRTTIVIAHRLSTIEHAHRVVAMDAGRVVEQGPLADLLAAGGLYARLHAMQFRT